MTTNHNITVYAVGCSDRIYRYGGWAAIIKNTTLDIAHEISGNDTETTDRRMIQTAISEALETVFQKFGCNNHIDLITPTKYIKRAIGDWKDGAPGRRPGWIHAWARRDWKKKNNQIVHNATLWEMIYNGICKQHTVRVTRADLIRNSIYLDRCHYLAVCARTNTIPTPFNYTTPPNVFDVLDRDGSFDFTNLVKTRTGWQVLVRGLRRLVASLDSDTLRSSDVIDIEQALNLLKLRLHELNDR